MNRMETKRSWTEWTDLAECAPDAPLLWVHRRLFERGYDVPLPTLKRAEAAFASLTATEGSNG